MKVIDLLNKIANGEEVPKKIIYDIEEYKLTKIVLDDNSYYFNYINEDMVCLFPINTNHLNDEAEIIEEDKKIDNLIYYNKKDFDNLDEFVEITTRDVFDKINEIIDKVNEMSDKE